jgi:hypothetical protein
VSHQIWVHGADATLEASGRSVPILQILLDGELGQRYLGRPAAVRTRYGVRFPQVAQFARGQSAGTESHRDQSLGCLAECGIPLSQEMVVEGERLSLRDALTDSLADFHLGQAELAWTATAYACYLPPIDCWANRFGERFSFDAVIKELMARPLNQASCCGMHVVHSLTLIARVDETCPILSEEVRSLQWSYLRKLSEAAVSRQQQDGSWAFNWHAGVVPYETVPYARTSTATPETTLLATAHVAEWLLILPAQMQVSRDVRRRAAQWLHARLRGSSEKDRLYSFCPYTHAAYSLRHWGRVSGTEASGQVGPGEVRAGRFRS